MLAGGGRPPVVQDYPGTGTFITVSPVVGASSLLIEMLNSGSGGMVYDEESILSGDAGSYCDILITNAAYLTNPCRVFAGALSYQTSTQPSLVQRMVGATPLDYLLRGPGSRGGSATTDVPSTTPRTVHGGAGYYVYAPATMNASGGSAVWPGTGPGVAGSGGSAGTMAGKNYGGGGAATANGVQDAGPGAPGYVRLTWYF